MNVLIFKRGKEVYTFKDEKIKRDITVKQILDIAKDMGIDKVYFKLED